MDALHQDWTSILLLVFVFGLKHGFDADHLATVDGLTRWNLQRRAPLAAWCGTLFSLGHGLVVVTIAVAAALLAHQWVPPQWLMTSGAGISIVVLLGLGVVNLHAVFSTRPEAMVQLRGLKGRWLGGLARTSHPGGVLLVGALFALSFDTLSLAALFAATAGRFGGAGNALLLGLLFTLGMLVADGANGWWISHLLRRADETARMASRVLGLTLGSLSLLVAAFGIAKLGLPAVDAWSEGKELGVGLGVMAVAGLGFVLAMRMARSAPALQRDRSR